MNSRKKQYRERRLNELKKDGKCLACWKRLCVSGKTMCMECVTRKRDRARRIRFDRKASGCCVDCNCMAITGQRRCAKHSEITRIYVRGKKAERLDSGRCVDCGRCKEETTSSRCVSCYLKHLSRTRLNDSRRWTELRELFAQQSLCPYTGIKLTLTVNASLDHKASSSRGGGNDISNLQWVYAKGYFDVNWMKGEMTDAEFKDAIKLIAGRL